ncbi:MAG: cytochrome C oxidase subunit III [Bdellovibrionales bacterium RBG_16_40_8]|nr:MAG: cytochrome C oxidase subunit III [Bdellovibrionales bacterium RBG_16_40_8]
MSTANTHTHTSHLAHHFQNLEHQFAAAKLGIWLFLCTEILMFGGLFVGYVIYHGIYQEMFAEGAKHLDWHLGAINTVVLLLSSFTMATGVHFAQKNESSRSLLALGATVICGLIFMIIKYFEYTHKFHLGLEPGRFFHFQGAEHSNLALYFSFYFLMTGLHGVHVLVGLGLIIWVMFRTRCGDFDANYYTAVECVGLFWHLVDLIWIYLFPLLYLVG